MVALLFCGICLIYEFADSFNVYDNTSYKCVVEQSVYPYSCVIVSFVSNFTLSATLIMAAVRERIFLLGGSYITSYTTSWFSSEVLPGVLKICIFSKYFDPLFSTFGHLVGFSNGFFNPAWK